MGDVFGVEVVRAPGHLWDVVVAELAATAPRSYVDHTSIGSCGKKNLAQATGPWHERMLEEMGINTVFSKFVLIGEEFFLGKSVLIWQHDDDGTASEVARKFALEFVDRGFAVASIDEDRSIEELERPSDERIAQMLLFPHEHEFAFEEIAEYACEQWCCGERRVISDHHDAFVVPKGSQARVNLRLHAHESDVCRDADQLARLVRRVA